MTYAPDTSAPRNLSRFDGKWNGNKWSQMRANEPVIDPLFPLSSSADRLAATFERWPRKNSFALLYTADTRGARR